MTEPDQDPIVTGLKSAVVHLGKAGFELAAAAGAIVKGVTEKVRPPADDDDGPPGRERIPVD